MTMNQSTDGLKLLLSYNIGPTDTRAYYEFVLGRYIPVLQALGLEMSEAWHTAYGEYPNRLVGFVCRDKNTMIDLLENDTWFELNDQLQEHVSDFSYKIIPYGIGFQI